MVLRKESVILSFLDKQTEMNQIVNYLFYPDLTEDT